MRQWYPRTINAGEISEIVGGKMIRIVMNVPYASAEGVEPYSQTLDWYVSPERGARAGADLRPRRRLDRRR